MCCELKSEDEEADQTQSPVIFRTVDFGTARSEAAWRTGDKDILCIRIEEWRAA